MSVKVTVFNKAVKEAMSKSANIALLAIGELMQDGLAANTHRVTGLLANSYNYRTDQHQSSFGDGPVTNSKQDLTSENYASQPPKFTVRTSSALVYTEAYNNRFKVFEQTIDQNQGRLGKVASAAYKKVIGT